MRIMIENKQLNIKMNEKSMRVIEVENPVKCVIVGRVNRFVVKVIVDGNEQRAYINNTGRLSELLVGGRGAFCVRSKGTGKMDYRLFAVEDDNLGAIIDTQLQMKAFERALETGLIPWLSGCRILRRNARLGSSLIDYLLRCNEDRVYLEVKSAVLRGGTYAMYPDCPSTRGRKHVKELTNHAKRGGKSIILFIAALPKVEAFKPNKTADPEIHKLLLEANKVGVKLRAIGMYYNPADSFIYLYNPSLKIVL